VREGVTIRIGAAHLQAAHALVAETLGRSGLTFKSSGEFGDLVAALGEHVRILVADHPRGIQGCMVAPFSGHAAHAWYCGSADRPVVGSMHLLHWEAMRLFRGMGVRQFDFTGVRIDPPTGSKQDGLLTFKKGFGGQLVRGFMWKYSLNPLKYAAYRTAMRLLKGGDIVDQEGHKLDAV